MRNGGNGEKWWEMVRYGEKWWESEDAMKLERGMSDEQIKAATHDLGCMMLYAL